MDYLPPIHRAAFRGDVEEVLRLIHQDPQLIGSTDDDGKHPLYHHPSRRGHVSVAAALVDHGANIDHQDRFGITGLYMACYNGHVPVVEFLMRKGADPALSTPLGWTPLLGASWNGHVGVVASLLHHPSVLTTIDHRTNDGETALYCACMNGHPDLVKMLLEVGADPTIRSNDGKTAMDIATEKGNQECISLLEEWDRSYIITKVRLLYDAFYRYHHQHRRQQGDDHGASSGSSSSGGSRQASTASNKRPRVETAIPTYLKERVEEGRSPPKVEMMDGYEEGSLVESVLEYVICGGLKSELFVDFMEMMGKTGYRQEETVGASREKERR